MAVFPKVDGPSGRGLMAPPGLRPWAPRVQSGIGSAFRTGSPGSALGSYVVSLRWGGTAPCGANINTALRRRKPLQPGFARWKCTPIPAARDFPRRGKFALRFTLEPCSKMLSIHSAPAFAGWQVRCFPVEKGGAEGTKGGKAAGRRLITAMWFLLMNPKVLSRTQPAADCLHLYTQRLLPADWYLIAFLSYASRTEILHFVQNDA